MGLVVILRSTTKEIQKLEKHNIVINCAFLMHIKQ